MLKLEIDNINAVQNNFWGNGAVYHCYAGMPDNAGREYTEEECLIEAERVGKMRLKLARTFYHWYAWDEKTNTWDWNNKSCQVLYKWLERMKKYNVTVALNTGWWCPGDINGTSCSGASPFKVEGDFEKSMENFGNWVSETVHQLIELRGFTNVKIFTLFTEPQHSSGKLPENLAQYDAWLACANAAHNALVRDNRRDKVLLMGPNEGSTKTSPMLKWLAEKNPDCVDIYSSHCYQQARDIPEKYLINGKNACTIKVPGGRIFQRVELTPNTDYTAEFMLALESENILRVSCGVDFGAFNAEEKPTILAGGEPTNRLTLDSVKHLGSAELSSTYKKYTVTFNSGENTQAFIGVFNDVKCNPDGSLYIGDIKLTEVATGKQLLLNREFENDFEHWGIMMAEGSVDAYYDWRRWCKSGKDFTPEGKMFIYDEYNTVYDCDFSKPEHGANLVVDALSFMNCGANSSLMWTLFDQQWPNNHTDGHNCFVDGDHRFGVMPVLKRSRVPYSAFYAFSLLSRYTGGENSAVFEGFGKNNVHLTMNKMADGNVTVVVVNNKGTDEEFLVDFERELGLKLNRHSFDPKTCVLDEKAEIPAIDKTVEVGSGFTDTIAAYGVNVYTTYND